MSDDVVTIRRALVSVYDKTGIEELARGLHEAGVELISTGSTAARIADAGVPVVAVQDVTGFPECLDGRVKTLHPNIHAALLADRATPEHLRELEELDIAPIDLVVVNLYPFQDAVAAGASEQESIEMITKQTPSNAGGELTEAALRRYKAGTQSRPLILNPSKAKPIG